MQVAVQYRAQLRTFRHRTIEVFDADPQRAAADLHELPKRGGCYPEKGRDSYRALPADQPHFDGVSFVGAGEDGYESLLDEVDVLDRNAGVLHEASRGEGDPMQQGTYPLQVPAGQRSQ